MIVQSGFFNRIWNEEGMSAFVKVFIFAKGLACKQFTIKLARIKIASPKKVLGLIEWMLCKEIF